MTNSDENCRQPQYRDSPVGCVNMHRGQDAGSGILGPVVAWNSVVPVRSGVWILLRHLSVLSPAVCFMVSSEFAPILVCAT